MTNTLLEVLEILIGAKRLVILLGPVPRATAEIVLRLARLLGATVLLTPDAKSLLHHADTAGVFSFGASETAKSAMALADVVLAICALSEFQCRSGKGLEGRTVIHLTSDPGDIGRNLAPATALVGDLDALTSALLSLIGSRVAKPREPWFHEYLPSGPVSQGGFARPGMIHPVAGIRAIESALPACCRVGIDVTSAGLYAYEHLRTTTEQRVFSSIEKSACMGEALMASIGIRLASGLPTLVITGDWCQCMTPSEIHTAVEHGIGSYVVVIWSNGGGAFIGEGIKQQGHRVASAAWRWETQPDFARVAMAFGARGVRVTDAAALEAAVAEGLRASRPTMVDAVIDRSVPVPAGDRFLTLSQSHG